MQQNGSLSQKQGPNVSQDCALYAKISDLGHLPDIQERALQYGLRVRRLSDHSELLKIYGSLEEIRTFPIASGYPRKLP